MARPDGAEALRKFGEYQRRRNLSPGTILQRRMRIRALGKWLGGDVLQASTDELEKWLDSCGRGSDGLAPQTRYVYVAALSAFYGWCFKQRMIRKDPTDDLVRPKLPKRQPRPWNEPAMAYALTQAEPRMRCFLLLAHLAGARCKEMSELRVEDIHRDQGVVMLHGKGDKDRLVPIHPLLLEALDQFGLPRAGFVFRKRDGKPLLPGTISRYVGNFLHGLDNPDTAHQGRHAFGTNAYRISGDLRMVQDLMGHESPATTAIYTAWAPERSAKVIGQLTLPLPSADT